MVIPNLWQVIVWKCNGYEPISLQRIPTVECTAGLPAPGGRRKAGGIFYRSGSKEGKERRDPNL